MEELMNFIRKFNEERDWKPFHTPNNLAKSIVLEANELLELFQFDTENFNKEKVLEELADVFTYCFDLADALEVDPAEIIYKKMEQNAKKYPVELAKGSNKKYTELTKKESQ